MSEEEKISAVADWYAKEARDYLDYRMGLGGSTDCESPIERLMLAALMAVAGTIGHVGRFNIPSVWGKSMKSHFRNSFLAGETWNGVGSYHYVIAPQFEIAGYRVDFCVLYTSSNPADRIHIVVECDGHEWHEKTKEQAQRDKERDRIIQAEGFQVFRFTGSEIWRDAISCAKEVFNALEEAHVRFVMGDDYEKYGRRDK